MAFKMNHIHMKTPDPQKTAQFYVDCLGAKIVGKAGTNGVRLDLHGVTVNVTQHIDTQTRDQVYGIEHIAIDTDELDKVAASVKAGGGRLLEEIQTADGRKVCFFEGPDGVQLEVLEMAK